MKGNEVTLEQKKVKAAFCYCEKGVFYVSALPHAETDKHSIKEFAKYARQGHRIDYISIDEMKDKFYKCDCYKDKTKKKQSELFAQ